MEDYNENITDQEVIKLIDRIKVNDEKDENLIKECMLAYLKLDLDTKRFMRKIYENMPKKVVVHKKPTDNKIDIIGGVL